MEESTPPDIAHSTLGAVGALSAVAHGFVATSLTKNKFSEREGPEARRRQQANCTGVSKSRRQRRAAPRYTWTNGGSLVKAVRLLQIVIVLAAGAYLVLLHDLNEVNVFLPFLFSLPPAVVVVLALLLGWLLGWAPSTIRGMRRIRENRRLRRRVEELEKWDPERTVTDEEGPVIPDRRPYDTAVQEPYEEHENL